MQSFDPFSPEEQQGFAVFNGGTPALAAAGLADDSMYSVPENGASTSNGKRAAKQVDISGAKGAAEFVKKLYNMLADKSHQHVVTWTASGDTFVVKDMNEFTKTILPHHFKHSNFASFVRQLNKYDFHKVKNPDTESGVYGDHIWEFKHPYFKSNMRDSLEYIKRKGPTSKKGHSSKVPPIVAPVQPQDKSMVAMQQQLDLLAQDQHNLNAHVGNMTREYSNMLSQVTFSRKISNIQSHILQHLIHYSIRLERRAQGVPENDQSFVPSIEIQHMMSAFNEVARMAATASPPLEEAQRASLVSARILPGGRSFVSGPDERRPPRADSFFTAPPQTTSLFAPVSPQQPSQPQMQPMGSSAPSVAFPQPVRPVKVSAFADQSGSSDSPPSSGLEGAQRPPAKTGLGGVASFSTNEMLQPASSGVSRGAGNSAVGWVKKPKILLVEDDAVCRKLSSKFLETFGCTIDIAADGVSAVNKMNQEKYDLVFMDIMMPVMDGVSATSLIRQFDPMTPIISMTSNSNPDDVLTYYAHGMSDILPKPFTKEGLFDMLDKHLIHLSQIQTLTEIPRALGISDDMIQNALINTFSDRSGSNPFADFMNDFDPTGESVSSLASLVTNVNEPAYSRGTKRDTAGRDGVEDSSSSKRTRLQEMF